MVAEELPRPHRTHRRERDYASSAHPMPVWLPIILTLYLLASLVTFIAYGLDKRAARAGRGRTRERTLHVMELLGGWPGALAAQRVFRHKTRDGRFRVVFW